MPSLRDFRLPPGIVYLGGYLPAWALHAAATYIALRFVVPAFAALYLPLWSILVLAFVSFPVISTARWELRPFFDKRAARSLGYALVPRVPGSGMQILKRLGEASKAGYMGQGVYEWLANTGMMTIRHRFINAEVIYTLEPEHVKAILATQFDSFEKGPMFIGQLVSLLGVGIFNSDGEMWKFHRAMTRPFFTRERISDFDIYDRNCAQTLATARERLQQGQSVDFQDLVGRFTLDSATEFLLGQNVGSHTAPLPYPPSVSHPAYPTSPATSPNDDPISQTHPSQVFVAAFGEAQERVAGRSALGKDWPIVEFWKDDVEPLRAILDEFTRPLLERALNAGKEGHAPANAKEESCLLAYLVKHTQDPKILKDEIVNLLVAGRDTTSSLLTFSFYMLSEHPEIEHRLRQEIFEKVGPTERPTYDQMREMKFTRAFLNEVLRLYPSVPVDSRTSNKATVLPCKNGPSFYVPPGTGCIYSVMYMHRRKDLWGPDALEFDPDRFLDSRLHKYLTPNPFIFCPFNAGPRICLGQQFAYHETTFFLVRLLQNFKNFRLDHSENLSPDPTWSPLLNRGDDPRLADKIRLASHLTLYVKGGLWVKMDPCNAQQEQEISA